MYSQYTNLIQFIKDNGHKKSDRTGTGTTSVFGTKMTFSLKDNVIPLIPDKKTPLNQVIRELVWFIRGYTCNQVLNDMGSTIWDEWQMEGGYLGPIYGHNWRRWPNTYPIVKPILKRFPISEKPEWVPTKEEVLDQMRDGYITELMRFYKPEDAEANPKEFKLWNNLIDLCLEQDGPWADYSLYLHEDFLWFEKFLYALKAAPGYDLWKHDAANYTLAPFYYGCREFNKHTLIFIPISDIDSLVPAQNAVARPNVLDDGQGTVYYNLNHIELANRLSLNPVKAYRMSKGFEKDGLTVTPIENPDPDAYVVRRVYYTDQLTDLLTGIINNPHSRRHMLISWNPGALDRAQLPACHVLFQLYVRDKTEEEILSEMDKKGITDRSQIRTQYLSSQMYQRSVDVGLGLPFNIASYAVLTRLLAEVANMDCEELIWVGGDTHIYDNHMEQLEELFNRETRPFPTMEFTDEFKGIYDFDETQIKLEGYNPHPHIKLDVAI